MRFFDVKCPRCGRRAVAHMRTDRIAGTYREPMYRMVAQRVICVRCGFNTTSESPIPYALWFKVPLRGRTVWARNEAHAMFLVGYLSGLVKMRGFDRSSVETLPGWLLRPKNRVLAVRRLETMLAAS